MVWNVKRFKRKMLQAALLPCIACLLPLAVPLFLSLRHLIPHSFSQTKKPRPLWDRGLHTDTGNRHQTAGFSAAFI